MLNAKEYYEDVSLAPWRFMVHTHAKATAVVIAGFCIFSLAVAALYLPLDTDAPLTRQEIESATSQHSVS